MIKINSPKKINHNRIGNQNIFAAINQVINQILK